MFYLNKDDLRRLREVTVTNVTYAKLTRILGDLTPSRNVQAYSLGDDLQTVAIVVLASANKEGWIDQYIIGLYQAYPAVDEIAKFHDMVLSASVAAPTVPVAAPPPPAPPAVPGVPPASAMLMVQTPDDFAVIYVNNRPFVNRRELRETLRKLAAPHGPRILRIVGDPRTGKTYTSYLISHLAQQFGFGVIPIDLARFSEPSPYEIGRSISARMGLPDPPVPGNEQWSRWILRYFDILSGHVQAAPSKRQWWIIMDNFKAVSVPEALNDFVDDLATRINQELADVRAVLISYERRLPPQVDPIVVEDKTCDIGIKELSEFFIQFLSEKQPHLDPLDRTSRAAAKVAEVWVNSRHEPGFPLDGIGAELLTQCKKIIEEEP